MHMGDTARPPRLERTKWLIRAKPAGPITKPPFLANWVLAAERLGHRGSQVNGFNFSWSCLG